MQARNKILLSFQSFTPSRKVSLQIRATKKAEDLYCFSYIITGVEYFKKAANRNNYKIRQERQYEICSQTYLQS